MTIKARRRGIILVMALVVMATLIVVLAVIAKEIVHERLLLEARERRFQAQWLARAGIEMAAAKLLESPEPFALKQDDLAPECLVEITVRKDQRGAFVVTADAHCGEDHRLAASSAERVFGREQDNGVIRQVPTGAAR